MFGSYVLANKCGESGEPFQDRDAVYAITAQDTEEVVLVTPDAIKQVPREKWRYDFAVPGDGYLNVHACVPMEGSQFQVDDFKFSLALEDIRLYMPHTAGVFDRVLSR